MWSDIFSSDGAAVILMDRGVQGQLPNLQRGLADDIVPYRVTKMIYTKPTRSDTMVAQYIGVSESRSGNGEYKVWVLGTSNGVTSDPWSARISASSMDGAAQEVVVRINEAVQADGTVAANQIRS